MRSVGGSVTSSPSTLLKEKNKELFFFFYLTKLFNNKDIKNCNRKYKKSLWSLTSTKSRQKSRLGNAFTNRLAAGEKAFIMFKGKSVTLESTELI